MEGDPITPENQHHEQQQHAQRADEAQLLADDGEDIVVVTLGEIEIFLTAFAEAQT